MVIRTMPPGPPKPRKRKSKSAAKGWPGQSLEPVEPTMIVPKKRLPVRPGTLADKLDEAAHRAMDVLNDTLATTVPPGHRQYVRMYSVRVRAATAAINALLRSDETKLRKLAVDRMPEIIKLIRAERAKLIDAEKVEEREDEGDV